MEPFENRKNAESAILNRDALPSISAEDDDGNNPALGKILEEHDAIDRLRTLPIWLTSLAIQLIVVILLALFHIGDKNRDTFELISQPNESESFDMGSLEDESPEIADFEIDFNEIPETPDQPVTDLTVMDTVPDMTLSDTAELSESDLVQPVQTVQTASAFEGRLMGKGKLLKSGGGNEASEQAVKNALKWIADHQLPDGSWSFQNAGANPGRAEANTAATAMAILPFLGAGNTPAKGEYKAVVARGIEYLLTCGKSTGEGYDLRDLGDKGHSEGRMYSHGLAAIALCEACAMTAEEKGKQFQALRAAAQHAVFFIQNAQDPAMGGWRYAPKDQPGDTSVTGWQVMALRSAGMGGLSVDPMVMKKAINFFVNQVSNDGGARYGYQSPAGTDATTAIGLLCRLYLDWTPKNPDLLRGADFLTQRGPNFNNAYYIYYATQVFHHIGGPRWTDWNGKVRDQLINSQVRNGGDAGSWEPGHDTYGGSGGRLYVTSLFCMTLEVYYRHMPLYAQSQFGETEENDFPLD